MRPPGRDDYPIAGSYRLLPAVEPHLQLASEDLVTLLLVRVDMLGRDESAGRQHHLAHHESAVGIGRHLPPCEPLAGHRVVDRLTRARHRLLLIFVAVSQATFSRLVASGSFPATSDPGGRPTADSRRRGPPTPRSRRRTGGGPRPGMPIARTRRPRRERRSTRDLSAVRTSAH